MKRKRTSRKKTGRRPTFREIVEASPQIQRYLTDAAICFGFVALMYLGLLVYGVICWLGRG